MKKKTNKERFLDAIPVEKGPVTFDIHAHMAALTAGREWLGLSAAIALRVQHLLKKGESRNQKWLAAQMDVSVQQVSKILRGQENLTLSTIVKLHNALGEIVVQVPDETASSEPKQRMPRAAKKSPARVAVGRLDVPSFAGNVTIVKRKVLRGKSSIPRTRVSQA